MTISLDFSENIPIFSLSLSERGILMIYSYLLICIMSFLLAVSLPMLLMKHMGTSDREALILVAYMAIISTVYNGTVLANSFGINWK